MLLIFCVPKKEEGTDDKEASLEAIRKISSMLKSLVNKISGIQIILQLTSEYPKKETFVQSQMKMQMYQRYMYMDKIDSYPQRIEDTVG